MSLIKASTLKNHDINRSNVKNLPTRTVINQQMLNFKEVPTEFIYPDAVLLKISKTKQSAEPEIKRTKTRTFLFKKSGTVHGS